MINLTNHQLAAFPTDLPLDSKILYLDRNQIETIPDSIGQFSQLDVLSLYDNQLTTSPEALWQLSQLQQLNLADNQFVTLPEGWDALSKL